MEQRFRDKDMVYSDEHESLPVVTISREAGCAGTEIAGMLALRLDALHKGKGKSQTWRVVNKEIIHDSAKALDLDPSMISQLFKGEKKGIIDDMVSSMSRKYYKSDWKIRKTITDIIRTIADLGYVIIVGRAGVVIARDYPKSLHIKLHAPQEWRTEVIQARHNISYQEARDYVNETDKSRIKLLSDFKCDKADCYLFDAVLNCKSLSKEQIVEIIIKLMEVKKII
ncbi:MAG: cytidylate kinase-like family protein [Bacteroidetes bacterium]|nr:cytidylate kinase-like family protein [Bacteroidota bacterium]